MDTPQIRSLFVEKDIKCSLQRMRLFEYLHTSPTHPTADQVYQALKPQIPTLSKTTIYNTLSLLVEKGLVRALTIDDSQVRYDARIADHGHFQCTTCRCVVDFSLDVKNLSQAPLEGFLIQDKQVHFKGLCPDCRRMKISTGKKFTHFLICKEASDESI